MKRIAKTLFDKSCEDLFPIKENLCKLIWKIVLYLTFFCAVLFLAMLLDATSLTRAFVAAFTGACAVPTIVTFFVEKRKSLRNEDMTIDEKALQLVQQYSESTPNLNKKNAITYYADDFAPSFEKFLDNLKLDFIAVSCLVISILICSFWDVQRVLLLGFPRIMLVLSCSVVGRLLSSVASNRVSVTLSQSLY